MLTIKYFSDIPRGVQNKKQAQQAIKIQPVCIYDAYNDYILNEIMCHDNIVYER